MTDTNQPSLLSDHVDMRLVAVDTDAAAPDRNTMVRLNPDHPGFRDQDYRDRRNRIAQIALSYRAGETIPDAPYTPQEHGVWRTIWKALVPAHQGHACAEYLEAIERL